MHKIEEQNSRIENEDRMLTEEVPVTDNYKNKLLPQIEADIDQTIKRRTLRAETKDFSRSWILRSILSPVPNFFKSYS